MTFVKFPVDIQIEILKYHPFFRSVNKTIHQLGRHAFEQVYGFLPITYKEYNKYLHSHPITLFRIRDDRLNAYYPRHDILCINIDVSHSMAMPVHYYVSNIHYTTPKVSKIFSKDVDFYDLRTTITILKRRGITIHSTFIKNYLNHLFPMGDSDVQSLFSLLNRVLYLSTKEEAEQLHLLECPFIFFGGKVKSTQLNDYQLFKNNIEILYQTLLNRFLCKL